MLRTWFSLLVFFFLVSISAHAQSNELTDYNEHRLQITRVGMLTLGGWALGNMAVSGALMGNSSGSRYYFHQMNIFWNIVNLGLAGFGYYNAATADAMALTLSESLQEQFGMEKLLLFNAGLDVAYIAGGFYLVERGQREEPQAMRWKGYGRSLILQGGFLLVFDAILYMVLHQPSDVLFSFLSQVQPASSGIGFIYRF